MAGCITQTVLEGGEGGEGSDGIRGHLRLHQPHTAQSEGAQVRLYSNSHSLKGSLLPTSSEMIRPYFHYPACHCTIRYFWQIFDHFMSLCAYFSLLNTVIWGAVLQLCLIVYSGRPRTLFFFINRILTKEMLAGFQTPWMTLNWMIHFSQSRTSRRRWNNWPRCLWKQLLIFLQFTFFSFTDRCFLKVIAVEHSTESTLFRDRLNVITVTASNWAEKTGFATSVELSDID